MEKLENKKEIWEFKYSISKFSLYCLFAYIILSGEMIMSEKKIISKKMPLAVPMLILLGTTDTYILNKRRSNNNNLLLLANCFKFKNERYYSEVIYGQRINDLEGIADDEKFKCLFKNKDNYKWQDIIKYLKWIDNTCVLDIPESYEDVKSIIKKIFDTRNTLAGVKYDEDYCQSIASLFIDDNPKKQENGENFLEYTYLDDVFDDIDIEAIKEIQMAFHAGDIWLDHNRKFNDLLVKFLDKNIPIKVIVNSPETADIICRHLRPRHQRNFSSFTVSIEGWKNYKNTYDNMQFAISNVPMMYNYIAFIMKNEQDSIIRVVYYTYGNTKMYNNHFIVIGTKSQYFDLYKKSFEYLWELYENNESEKNQEELDINSNRALKSDYI